MNHQRLANGNNTLLRAGDRALEHEVVVLDDSIVREATERRDALLRYVMLGRRVGLVVAAANTVDLLVELRTMVVAVCMMH